MPEVALLQRASGRPWCTTNDSAALQCLTRPLGVGKRDVAQPHLATALQRLGALLQRNAAGDMEGYSRAAAARECFTAGKQNLIFIKRPSTHLAGGVDERLAVDNGEHALRGCRALGSICSI